MKALIHNLFLAGCILYLPAIVAAVLGWKISRNIFFLTAVVCMLLSAIIRIRFNWPLTCLFQEPYLISFFIALIAVYLHTKEDETACITVGVLSAALSVFTFLFPGDIYSSFVKTNTLLAHFFSLSSSLARAAYLSSGALATWYLLRAASPNSIVQEQSNRDLIKNLAIVGFSSQSVGIFCGALWSYVGWGFPVQWKSHVFLGMVGVWFYYSFFLHLHLEGGTSRKAMLYAASAGTFIAFFFSFLPDTGAFSFRGFIR